MIDKLKDEIIQLLQQREVAHLALSGPDGPWASVVRFISADLTLYLIEPQTSDLVFYAENDPQVVFCIDGPEADPEGHQQEIQLFGIAQILAPYELHGIPDDVQRIYGLRNREVPGIYVVIEVVPRRVYRVTRSRGAIHRDTIDVDSLSRPTSKFSPGPPRP